MSAIIQRDTFQALVEALRCGKEPDTADCWPADQMKMLSDAGGNRWNISAEYGGDGASAEEMLQVYRELSSGSLLTTFILTQRNAACQRIESSSNKALAARLLPALSRGELFATVGISHLTTSRQHLRMPAVSVTELLNGDGFCLHGAVPWATAALHADVIVTGGTLPDGRQILAAVPRDREGLRVRPPMSLMGLSSAQTSEIELQDVMVSREEILHGPVERVMSIGMGGGAGSLGTSAVAIGTAQGILRRLARELERRPELSEFREALENTASGLARQLAECAAGSSPAEPCSPESLRQRANSLVIRSAQLWLGSTKGAGFVSGHPAERAVRESMFFMVWSCPQLVLEGNLREISCAMSEV